MAQLQHVPTAQELQGLLGAENYAAWQRLCAVIDSLYDMDRLWNDGGKKWQVEYKYRRGGKTLCALYAKQNCLGLMLIFGREERDRVEALRGSLAVSTMEAYDAAATYHDGKWVMFDAMLPSADLQTLLGIKRRPNKK